MNTNTNTNIAIEIKMLKKRVFSTLFKNAMANEPVYPVMDWANNEERLCSASELHSLNLNGCSIYNLKESVKRKIRELYPDELQNAVTYHFYNS